MSVARELVSLRISADERKKLELAATLMGVTISELIRDTMSDFADGLIDAIGGAEADRILQEQAERESEILANKWRALSQLIDATAHATAPDSVSPRNAAKARRKDPAVPKN
jgi:hypothetical protein